MKHKEYRVTFLPSNRYVFALPGTVLLEAAARVGLVLETPCGGSGTCGKCKVRVVGGKCPPTEACIGAMNERDIRDGFRLACQAEIQGETIVEIPDSSLFEARQQIVTHDSGDELHVQPAISKVYLEMPAPDGKDSRADVVRLRETMADASFGKLKMSVLRTLPASLREASYKGTAVVVDNELIGFEPGNTESDCYGAAFDLGTTTLVGTLVHLPTGGSKAIAARLNPQTVFGDDVVSRLRLCRENAGNLEKLRSAIIGEINAMLDNLAEDGGIPKSSIYEAVLAGNTTMQQIACGIDSSPLGELPFTPAFRDALNIRAADLGLTINPAGRVYVFPQIGGFVGGDTVAGILATCLDREPEPVLLVDVGTNGEIVLAHDGMLTATSVAAGPAFEGARISRGMRATSGAIEKVVFADDVEVNVIHNVKPMGLCGSGLIDAVAGMLRVGAIDPTGRIIAPDEAPADMPAALRKRLTVGNGHVDFMLVHGSGTADGKHLFLSQRDIRELQLANAAIRAGINILLKMEGIQASRLSKILLAGGFGSFMRRSNAQRIGLLPPVPHDRIRFIGNAASLGAKRLLLSVAEKEYAAEIAGKTRHLDLSLFPDFQEEFSSAMLFPGQEFSF